MHINNSIVKLNYQPSGGKSWIAKIIGRHPKYILDRKFINGSRQDMSSSGKTGSLVFNITEDGYYEVNEAWKKNKYYLKVINSVITEINYETVVTEFINKI
jgi:hypothetical protein